MLEIFSMLAGQPWYAMAGEAVGVANVITMFIKNNFAKDSPIMGKVIQGLNFLALNVFRNANDPDK